jgi:glycosyltransferase involved in cell wall biosynthesis
MEKKKFSYLAKDLKLLMLGPGNLGPYHYARFHELKKYLPNFIYVKLAIKEHYRPWMDQCKTIDKNKIIELKKGQSLFKLILKEKPDFAICIGYHTYKIVKAGLCCLLLKIPCIIQFDSTLESSKQKIWKELLKSLIIRTLFKYGFVAGNKSAEYLMRLGVKEKFMWYGVDVVDNAHFYCPRSTINNQDKISSKTFITVARLSSEKNIDTLIEAYKIYRRNGGTWELIIVGTGPDEKILRGTVPKEISQYICWYGWASYEELPTLYNIAKCFILTSTSEPWGLVVNEAMAARLPIIISKKCGCIPELLIEGKNGYSFDPKNPVELSMIMSKISSSKVDIQRMGTISKMIINKYNPEKWARTIVDIGKKIKK